MTELVKAFQAGDVETFKTLLSSANPRDKNITNLFKALFNSDKYWQQKEMLGIMKAAQLQVETLREKTNE